MARLKTVTLLVLLLLIALYPKPGNLLKLSSVQMQNAGPSPEIKLKVQQATTLYTSLLFPTIIVDSRLNSRAASSSQIQWFVSDFLRTNYPGTIIFFTPENNSKFLEYLNAEHGFLLMGDAVIQISPSSEVVDRGNPFSQNEIAAYQTVVNSSKSLLITFDYYTYWTNISPTVIPYGISAPRDTVYDDTNYYGSSSTPYVHVWENNSLALRLSSNKLFTKVEYKGTYLVVDSSLNTTDNTIYIIGIGDNDTHNYSGNVKGADIIYFAAVERSNGGKLFVSGSWRFIYYAYYSNYVDNDEFLKNIIDWLIEYPIYIANVTYPVQAGVGCEYAIPIKIAARNPSTNVTLTITVPGFVDLLNSSTITIGNLDASETYDLNIVLRFKEKGFGFMKLELYTNEGYKFVKYIPLEAVTLATSAKFEKPYVKLLATNSNVLQLTISNPTPVDYTDIMVAFELPQNVTSLNGTEIGPIAVPSGSSVTLKIVLEFAEAGTFTVKATVYSKDTGTTITETTASTIVFSKHVLIFDNGHAGYYNIYKMKSLITDFLAIYFDYYISNGTITSDILEQADLLLILNPQDNYYSSDEIQAIVSYIDSGGKAILLLDGYGNGSSIYPDVLDPLLSKYGMQSIKAMLWDNSTGELKYYIDKTQFVYDNSTPISAALNYKITLVYPTSNFAVFNITTRHLERDGVSIDVYPLITGGPLTVPINSSGAIDLSLPKYLAAVAITNTSGALYVFGSAKLLAYDNWNSSSNKAFLRNILAFFFADYKVSVTAPKVEVGTEATITVTVKNKGFVDIRRFNVTLTPVSGIDVVSGTAEEVILYPGKTANLTLRVLVTTLGTVNVTITYIAGGIAPQTLTVTISSEDTTAPTIVVTSPENRSTLQTKNVTLTFKASDNYKLARVLIYIDGELVLNQTVDNAALNYNSTITLEEGQHKIKIVAIDVAGNTAEATIVFTVSLPAPSSSWSSIIIVVIVVVVTGAAAGVAYYYLKVRKK